MPPVLSTRHLYYWFFIPSTQNFVLPCNLSSGARYCAWLIQKTDGRFNDIYGYVQFRRPKDSKYLCRRLTFDTLVCPTTVFDQRLYGPIFNKQSSLCRSFGTESFVDHSTSRFSAFLRCQSSKMYEPELLPKFILDCHICQGTRPSLFSRRPGYGPSYYSQPIDSSSELVTTAVTTSTSSSAVAVDLTSADEKDLSDNESSGLCVIDADLEKELLTLVDIPSLPSSPVVPSRLFSPSLFTYPVQDSPFTQ